MIRGNYPKAGLATAAYFLVTGIVIGGWAAAIPMIKARLGEGTGVFGAALFAMAGGAVLAMPLAGALINRFGSRPIVGIAGLLIGILYLGPVLSTTLPAFIVTGFAFGAVMGVLDVAMNTQGLAVEQQSSRPLMSGLHGAYSVGGLIGALLGGVLVDLFGLIVQALIISLLCIGTVLFARPHLLPSAVDKGLSTTHFGWPTWRTLRLGVLCFLTLMGEGAFVDWSGLFLQTRFEVDAGFAATGFAMFSAGMAVSRFAGDALRVRFGAVRLVRWSAVFTMAGTAAGLLSPNPVLTVVLFVLAGIGIGNIAPVLFAGGGRLEPNAPGRGIAAVTTLGYSGLLAGPPLIGIIAEFSGLGPALWLIVFAAFIIALGARAVRALD